MSSGRDKRAVSVIGSGTLGHPDPRYQLARDLGRALIDHGHRLVCGGRGGVMAAAARGAHESEHHAPGVVVGLLPGSDPAGGNRWLDVALPTGLGHLRNGLVARSEAVVAVGGGAGTLTEMGLAWIFDREVIAYRCEGWSGRLADQRIDDRVRFEDRPDDRVYGVESADEVIALLERLL